MRSLYTVLNAGEESGVSGGHEEGSVCHRGAIRGESQWGTPGAKTRGRKPEAER